jgi:pimeloyl-ACP methyl ester carboxylesterase
MARPISVGCSLLRETGRAARNGRHLRVVPIGRLLGSLLMFSVASANPSVGAERFQADARVLRDGALMSYLHRPAEPGQSTLVLIPETHGDRFQFLGPLVEALPAGQGLVIVESRGQGRSWPPPDAAQASIEEYATDVLEVVAHLDLKAWYVGGHSLGGMQAIEIAGRSPAGLRGVISLEGWTHHEVQAAAFAGAPARTAEQRQADQLYREERYARLRWTEEEYRRLVSIWRRWTTGEAILRTNRLPLLSVWGDRGLAVRPDRETLRLPPEDGCELVWIEGSDHYVTRGPHAAAVGQAIARFIARIETGPSRQPNSN